jgi:PilZ domain
MSEYTITQDQIDALLGEVSIEDRVHNQFAKIKNKISRMLHKTASRELLTIKKSLGEHLKLLEANKPFSLEFIDSFKVNFKHFSRNALKSTQDYALFELIVKLENMIGAMFYQVDQERRRYPRFPLTIDLSVTLENKVHKLFGADISNAGMSFYAPIELIVGRRYDILIPASGNDQLHVDVLRTSRIEPEQLNIFRTACAFPNLLSWDRIRDIIKTSMEGVP